MNHIRSESVEQKTKQVAVKLEEKRKTVEAKQEAARIEFKKQLQAKQERFKDVLQQAHEKEELLVKVCLPGCSARGFKIKAAFHFRVFHTHVYARKTLNPSTLYIF